MRVLQSKKSARSHPRSENVPVVQMDLFRFRDAFELGVHRRRGLFHLAHVPVVHLAAVVPDRVFGAESDEADEGGLEQAEGEAWARARGGVQCMGGRAGCVRRRGGTHQRRV